ncbi:MAG TPA: hypothetical protein VJS88_02500, partial [Chthoniobacterales bacterium]|nr:hypothetical protein [Chthoniobacterales bacterium]
VGTQNNVLIGGIGVKDDSFANQSQTILFRAIGPSLVGAGLSNTLSDPFLELHDAQGAQIVSNDDWGDSPDAGAISAAGLAPASPKESAILRTLSPGSYTAVVRGAHGEVGVGNVEAFNLGNQ